MGKNNIGGITCFALEKTKVGGLKMGRKLCQEVFMNVERIRKMIYELQKMDGSGYFDRFRDKAVDNLRQCVLEAERPTKNQP
jgi:hypothetical protein